MDRDQPTRERPSREDLEPFVMAGATLTKIARELGATPETVRRWITRVGLPQPIAVRRAQVAEAIQAGTREVTRTCARHGETTFALVGSDQRPRCKACRGEAVARRRRKVKMLLIEEAGGQCQLCGFSGCAAALQFHHVDPARKHFGIAQRGLTRSIEQVRAEAKKCVLLCSNCHAAVEVGFAELPLELGAVKSLD